MCKCPQDGDYKTSSECPLNKHYSHDFSHASSMWTETNRRTATRERTSMSSTFPVSRVTIRAKPARDAALSSWMYPPAVAQRLADVCLPVFSSCVHLTSAHLILQQRNTICERFTTCKRRVVVIGSRGPSTRGRLTIDRRSISRLTSDLPSATCKRTPVLLTHKGLQKPFHQPRFHSKLEIQPPLSSSPVSNRSLTYLPFSAAMQEIVQFHVIERFNENVTLSEKHTLDDQEQFRNALSETFSSTHSHLTSKCFKRPQPQPAPQNPSEWPGCASCALSPS